MPLVPLPINVRPRLGETTDHYIQRLARANHLRPSDLLQHLTPPPHKTGRRPQLSRLAALSGRSTEVLAKTLADAGPADPADHRHEAVPPLLRRERFSRTQRTRVTQATQTSMRIAQPSLRQIN
ncbi:TniQ family protein [Streptomyces sp. NPDC059866]|uniref:TniQ family protein n=1 Tax=Streptomyces sp. NPDC059866 TaxID=3346978 RepID=UPI00364EBB10